MPNLTFLFVTFPGWDFNVRHAGTTIAMGYCHGFERLGIRWKHAPEPELEQILRETENPIVFLGYDNYARLTDNALRLLENVPHFIWVNVWFDGMAEQAARYGHPNPTLPSETLCKILNSNASFLFTGAPESYFGFWENWIKAGQRLESLPEACDTAVYFRQRGLSKFDDVQIAFVSRYSEYKEPFYAQYLWPYEDKLSTFGYNEWPRCYRGYLPNEQESRLYQDARVVPSIGEPFQWETGTVYECPFKVLGSGGLTITDGAPSYREMFTDDELLMPESLGEYQYLMDTALRYPEFNETWRKRGYKAVVERHTYAHRAQKILRLLGEK